MPDLNQETVRTEDRWKPSTHKNVSVPAKRFDPSEKEPEPLGYPHGHPKKGHRSFE